MSNLSEPRGHLSAYITGEGRPSEVGTKLFNWLQFEAKAIHDPTIMLIVDNSSVNEVAISRSNFPRSQVLPDVFGLLLNYSRELLKGGNLYDESTKETLRINPAHLLDWAKIFGDLKAKGSSNLRHGHLKEFFRSLLDNEASADLQYSTSASTGWKTGIGKSFKSAFRTFD